MFPVSNTVSADVGEGRPRWASYLGVATLYLLVVLAALGVGAIMVRLRGRSSDAPAEPVAA